MAISNKVGPPVTGEDFYGRTEELRQAQEYLNSNHSLVLSAPRRIGKSSFAKRLIEIKSNEGWKCAYIDLEGVRTKEEFLRILINHFEKSGIWNEAINVTGSFIKRLFDSIKGIGPVELDFSTPVKDENLYASLSEAIDHSMNTLIVIDEITLFLNVLEASQGNTREASFFLNWFRSLRQVSQSKIRWIFCGSVGLHNYTKMRNLSMAINDLLNFDFDALSESEAFGLIKELAEAEKISFSPESIRYLLHKVEWHIPYFLQLLFTNLKNHKDAKIAVSTDMIDMAFEKLARSTELSTWSERLSEYNGVELLARLILKELCKSQNGLNRDQLLSVCLIHTDQNPIAGDEKLSLILTMLEHDGYIMRAEGGLRRFRSPLLQKWWYYNFVE